MSFIRKICLSAGLALGATAAQADENVMVVFDGSNSMWGQIDGTAKIEIARGVMKSLLGEWTEDREVGLMAYGHRRRGDCTDIETLVQPTAGARDDILKRINAIKPTGKTPLSDAVEQAALALSYTDKPATVVLISDGLESCDRDPCALAAALEKGGVSFTTHVVGFGLGSDEDAASLACIAEETGGKYISARNATELEQALSTVSTAVAEAPASEPVPEPEPEPEVVAPAVIVTGPNLAVGGSEITVTWDPTISPKDYITIVPIGTEEGEFGEYATVGDKDKVEFAIPGTEGAYELRYIQNDGRKTLGSAPIEVTKPQVTLSGPETAVTGEEVRIEWSPTIYKRDYVTIVPMGSDEGTFGNYVSVSHNTRADLVTPADPGMYEIRYMLRVDNMTVASIPLEVTLAEVTLEVPKKALTGGDFKVSWSTTINSRDYVAIVPKGAEEGEFGNYLVVRDDAKGKLKAPADTGLYEVRYILREDSRTIARAYIEVTEPEVTVAGPETALAGSKVKVSWTGTVAENDYVTIVEMGADEGTYGAYVVVRDDTEKVLLMPAKPGIYEVRYVLREGAKTMARTPVEITEPEVTVSAPATVIAGSQFEVSWTGAVNENDYVTIVPIGTEEGEHDNYVVVRSHESKELQAPADVGMYEVRYILREGTRTMATAPVEITAPSVTLGAPETARAGEAFPVSWTGAVSPNDYITIVSVGTDEGEHNNYFTVRTHEEKDLQAPSQAGMYEIRYILREGAKTMATLPIEIIDPSVTLQGPDAVRAGDTMRITWTGTVSGNDYITIVPMGTDDGDYGEYFSVRSHSEHDLVAPDQTGMYELRYVLREGTRVVARQMVEVLASDAALETGASLTAPDSAAPGSTIEVSWRVDSESADQRITLAAPDQAMFTWIAAVKIKGTPPVNITLPTEAGTYELRILDVSNQSVLTRKVISVE